ncbi:MAG: hypothetical protein HRF50_07495 [Phycisphaerae bacterium]
MNSGLGDGWLILHGGALGDLALTVQFALRLPGVSPASTLTVISRVRLGDLSDCQPAVRCLSSDSIGAHWLHADSDSPPPARLRELVAGATVWNALTDERSVVHPRLLSLKPRALWSTDPRPEPGVEAHITEQWRRRLERLGLSLPTGTFRRRDRTSLSVPESLRQRGRRQMNDALHYSSFASRQMQADDRRVRDADPPDRLDGVNPPLPPAKTGVVLIHPGGGSRAKCWPLESFLSVARRVEAAGRAVAFVVGPVELDVWPRCDLDAIRSEFALLVPTHTDELAALLAGAAALLSNDSGPAHLAALLGTPTVTLFGPTSPTVWRPLGHAARALEGQPDSHGRDWGVRTDEVVQTICTVGSCDINR